MSAPRRLTVEVVAEMRSEWSLGRVSLQALADRYRLSRMGVCKIVNRYTYKEDFDSMYWRR